MDPPFGIRGGEGDVGDRALAGGGGIDGAVEAAPEDFVRPRLTEAGAGGEGVAFGDVEVSLCPKAAAMTCRFVPAAANRLP